MLLSIATLSPFGEPQSAVGLYGLTATYVVMQSPTP